MSLLDTPIMEHKPSEDLRPDQEAEGHDLSQVLLAYVDRLSPSQQEVLRLKFQSGLSYKEIAEVTDKSVNHVGVILHQALKRLKTHLTDAEETIFNELRP